MSVTKKYFNPKFTGSYAGLSTFIKNRKLGKSKKEVENELLRHPSYYFYRPARRLIKKRRPVIVHLPNFQLVADLIDVQRFEKENRGFRYILIAIDGFSRKMYTEPLKDKKGGTLVAAARRIFKTIPRMIKYWQSDAGTEFKNKQFQDFLESKGIIWFSTYSAIKASLAERAISTLMTRLSRVFTQQQNHHYLKVLPSIVQSYNNTIHTTTKFAPNKVNSKNQDQVWENIYGDLIDSVKTSRKKFSVGDQVRLSVVKNTFDKGYLPRYTEEIFKISEVNDTIPVTYYVSDSKGERIKGSFYESELLTAT